MVEPSERPPIAEQVSALAHGRPLQDQMNGVAYGQVTFEIRDGRVYRVNVTLSHVFNEQDVLGTTIRRTVYKTPGK